MSLYTCISCRVAFATPDLQKAHYRTDWHRYNLKRKVADLLPVTALEFHQRVLERKAQVAQEEKDQGAYCKLCNKHFGNSKAYANHVQSKKHKEKETKESQALVEKRNEKNAVKGIDVAGTENNKELHNNLANLAIKNSDGATSSGTTSSGATSSGSSNSTAGNVMGHCIASTKTSSKKTPEAAQPKEKDDYEEDDESDGDSWESVEGEALPPEACLFCSRISKSLEKNMRHMTRVHSFFIPDAEYLVDLDGLISYLGEKVGEGNMCLWCSEAGKTFYSNRAAQQHMQDKGHCMMLHEGDALLEYADFYNYRSSYPDHEEKKGARRDDDDDDEDVDIEQLAIDGYELVLPSGATIGHRSLKLYYKQNLPPRKYFQSSNVLPRLLAQYKALGWTGTTGVAAQKKAKDVTYLQNLRAKQRLQLSVKANKFQKFYRPQVIF